ncbi:MAG TPA: hypothetical protein ENK28_04285 [Aliiroseovarius sp.]|nr:hypothetical protein [Aliiroseovarius sp.]
MAVSDLPPMPDDAFWRAFQGDFQGILTWPDFDSLWAVLGATKGDWYVYDLTADVPSSPVSGRDFDKALSEAGDLYSSVRNRSYCGAVYVDDPRTPTFVKVFDPYQMGATCGSSGSRTMPRFVFSRIIPTPLSEPVPDSKPGLLARLSGRA